MLKLSIHCLNRLLFTLLVVSISACGGGNKKIQSKPVVKAPSTTKTNNKVKPISPAGEVSHGALLFSWSLVKAATDYELRIDSTKDGLKTLLITSKKASCNSAKKTCTYKPSIKFKQSDRFSWKVKSKVAGKWSSYGDSKSVVVKKAVIPPPATTGIVKLLKPKPGEIYFGVFSDFGWSEDDVKTQKIQKFDQLAQKSTAWSYFSNNWRRWEGDQRVAEIKYPKEAINTIRAQGKIPFVRLLPWTKVSQIKDVDITNRSSQGINLVNICHDGTKTMLVTKSELSSYLDQGDVKGNCDNPFSMQSIIDGKWDTVLKVWANTAKNDVDDKGQLQPLLATFTIEMNGYWFPWSGIYNGGANKTGYGDPNLADGPERYRDAYRHIIDLFREQGVKNITWFFVPDTMDPNEDWVSFLTESWNAQKNYYPGDDYIDWIGTNLYGAAAKDYDWTTFSDDWAKKKQAIDAITSKKPLALMEFGVIENHTDGTKTDWLNNAFSTIEGSDYPFQAISYWHDDWSGTGNGMKIDSSDESLATFRNRIKSSKYKSSLRFSK